MYVYAWLHVLFGGRFCVHGCERPWHTPALDRFCWSSLVLVTCRLPIVSSSPVLADGLAARLVLKPPARGAAVLVEKPRHGTLTWVFSLNQTET